MLSRFFKSLIEGTHSIFLITRLFITILMLSGIALGAANLAIDITRPENIFRRDITQWLVANLALRNSEDPYQPIPDLTLKFFSFKSEENNHPTPYPPPFLLLSTPLSFVSPLTASHLWLSFSVMLLFFISYLLLLLSNSRPMVMIVSVVAMGLFILPPVIRDLQFGQTGILCSALMILTGLLYLRARDKAAGVVMGLLLSLKFFGVPLLIMSVLRKEWKLLNTALITFLTLNIACVPLFGFESFFYYYREVAPTVTSSWLNMPSNISLASIPAKILTPLLYTRPPEGRLTFHSPEHILSHELIAICLLLAISFIGLIALFSKSASRKVVFSRAALLSVVAAPISWPFLFLLLFVPISIFFKCTLRHGLLCAAVLGLCFYYGAWSHSKLLPETALGEYEPVSLLVLLLSCVPTIFIACLSLLYFPSPQSPTTNLPTANEELDSTQDRHEQLVAEDSSKTAAEYARGGASPRA